MLTGVEKTLSTERGHLLDATDELKGEKFEGLPELGFGAAHRLEERFQKLIT